MIQFHSKFSVHTLKAVLLLLAILLFGPASDLEASRARPRLSAASENVRLTIPRVLTDFAEKGLLGLEFESKPNRELIEATVASYIGWRRHPHKSGGFEKQCQATSASDDGTVLRFLCTYDAERKRKPTETTSVPKPSRSQRRELAEALIGEQWEAVSEIPYPSVVGIVGSIDTKSDLVNMGRSLSEKSQCVGSKPATAIAYKLEEHFPDSEAIAIASKLYSYAASCGSDFAAAKSAYRLALLEIWQNRCERVPQLMSQVEASPDAMQFHSRAQYWKAYCAEALGKRDVSKVSRQNLMSQYPLTFHNLAANAADASATEWLTRETNPPIAFRSLIRPDLNALVRSVEALTKAGATDLASDLTDHTQTHIQQLEPEVRLYLAAILHRFQKNQSLAKFRILAALFQDAPRMVSETTMKMYFPLWFFDTIKPNSKDIDPFLVTALIRQESAFNTQARSRVGARGLMQLMPATARMLSRVRTSKLYDPKTNIELGTMYLRKRLEQYGGDVELTLAAYNAGFNRVDDWKRRYPTENRILFLDLIPFRETRDYVASILRNYYWYTKLYSEAAARRNLASEEKAVPADKAAERSNPYQAIVRAQSGLMLQLPTEPVGVESMSKEDGAP